MTFNHFSKNYFTDPKTNTQWDTHKNILNILPATNKKDKFHVLK